MFYLFIVRFSLEALHAFSQIWERVHRPQYFDAVGWVPGSDPACKNLTNEVLAWLSSGAKCKLLAYGPAYATATPSCLLQQNPEWFILLVPTHLGSPRQRVIKR